MKDNTKKALEIVQAAILLGVLGDGLLRAASFGINLTLWLLALTAAVTALIFRHHDDKSKSSETGWLLGSAIVFSFLITWRDAGMLKFLDFLAVMLALSLTALPIKQIGMRTAHFTDYFINACYAGFSMFLAPFGLIFSDIKFRGVGANSKNAKILAVIRGLLFAVPILFVFGILFMAADAVFENIVQNTLNVRVDQFFSHIFLIGFLAWTTAGFLRFLVISSSPNNKNQMLAVQNLGNQNKESSETEAKEQSLLPNEQNRVFSRFGIIETSIVLGTLNALFLSFVAIQLPYLFGGASTVLNNAELSYAEYARRGFFELVTVTFLNLLLLLAMHWLLDKTKASSEKVFRILSSLNIGLLAVVMVSALKRMFLYQTEYGLTELRIYTTAFMLWLGFVLGWFMLTVLRGRRELFMSGAFGSALVVLFALHVPNLQKTIVQVNFERAHQQKSFDLLYLLKLSDDAVPEVVEQVKNGTFDEQCNVLHEINNKLKSSEYGDWRTWSWSRQNAVWEMHNYLDARSKATCPAKIYDSSYFE